MIGEDRLKWIFSLPVGNQLAAAFGIAIIFLVSVIGTMSYNWKSDTKLHSKYDALLVDSLVNCNQCAAKQQAELSKTLLNFFMSQDKSIDKIQSGLNTITSN